VQEEVVKSPDWIQELYLKEMVYKSTKGEKTHEKYGTNATKTAPTNERDRKLSGKVQPQKSNN